MPGQWEYQIGPLGPLDSGDQPRISRWLLYRISEEFGVSATLHPKPVKGDWKMARSAHQLQYKIHERKRWNKGYRRIV